MAYTPTTGSPSGPAPSGYRPVAPSGSAPAPSAGGYKPVTAGPAQPAEEGGVGLFDFLGNVAQEAGDMVQGITALGGAIVHDVGHTIGDLADLDPGEADYVLDDIAMALPKAIAQDYNQRYGISKFAEGDFWGGLKAVFTGLYERPLSAIGDALMVGTGAKLAAKAGMLGEAGKAAVLGPGAMEAVSLTGAERATTALGLSQNPVARVAQRKLYDVLSYNPKGLDARMKFLNPLEREGADVGTYLRASANRSFAEEVSLPVLKWNAGKAIEKHSLNKTLSLMGFQVGHRAHAGSAAVREIFQDLDEVEQDLAVSGLMGTTAVGLLDEAPSTASPVHYTPVDDVPLPEAVGELATPGLDAPALSAASGAFGDNLIAIKPDSGVISPHHRGTEQSNVVVLLTDDMADAANMARRYADATSGGIEWRMNYAKVTGDDVPGASYVPIHFGVRSGSGQLHDVAVMTRDMFEQTRAWSHQSKHADALAAKVTEAETMMAQATPETAMALASDVVKAQDELDAARAWNAHTYDFSRRSMNGGEYNKVLQALDRMRYTVYNHATAGEIDHGLTFRAAWDRAFGPIRAERWAALMKNLETDLAKTLEAHFKPGGKARPRSLEELRQTKELPVSVLAKLRQRSNRLGTEEYLRKLGDSKAKNIPVVIVYDAKSGLAALFDGHHRLEVAMREGRESLPVRVDPIDTEMQKKYFKNQNFEPLEELMGGGAASGDAAAAIDPIIRTIEAALGENNPWTEAVFRSKVDEIIRFQTGYSMPGALSTSVATASLKPIKRLTPFNEREIAGLMDDIRANGIQQPILVRQNGSVFDGNHRLEAARRLGIDEVPVVYIRNTAHGQELMQAAAEGRKATFSGALRTGEKTILDDGRVVRRTRRRLDPETQEWVDVPVDEQAAQVAERIANVIRDITREAMVENGEFEGLDWATLLREQAQSTLPIPQYYPHIKRAGATGDVVMAGQPGAKTIINSETSRMKEWGGWLYERGAYDRNPIKAYEQLFQQTARHLEFRDTMLTLARKYGRRPSQDELHAWTLAKPAEVLVSENGLKGMISDRTRLMSLTHEGVMAGKTLEKATMDALEVLTDQALESFASGMKGDKIWALPRHVAEQMKRSQKLNDLIPGTFNFYYDTFQGLWKAQVLKLSPRWVVNNTLGNIIFMGVKNPGAIRDFIAQLMPGAETRARALFGDTIVDAVHRGYMHAENYLPQNERLGRRADAAGSEIGRRLADSPVQNRAPVRGLRKVADTVGSINTHIEDAARRGVFINSMSRQRIHGVAGRFMSTRRRMETMAQGGIASERKWDAFIDEVNATLGDYLSMSPVESQIIRRYLAPFWGFYRHTLKFLARMPFEHPGKMRVLQSVEEIDRQMNPFMPDYMRGSFEAWDGVWARFGAGNPLEALTEGYWPAMANPLLGLAVQRATGTNPFGQKWYPPQGAVVETAGGDRYMVIRNAEGQVTGIRQFEGEWQPPLYQSLTTAFMPQAGLLFDPWDRSVAKRISSPLTGLAFNTSYDPATEAYHAQRSYIEALGRAASSVPEG